MKSAKSILSILPLFLLPLFLYAQEFAPIGATWHFNYYLFVAVEGYEKITVEKDTVLFGKQATKLVLERVTKIYPSNDLHFHHEVHFLHQTGDSIWHFDPNTSNQNDFHILFDFSLMPGDTLFYDDFGYHYLVIDSVGTIDLNGGQYPVQYGSTPFSPMNLHEKVIISEKTGTLNTYLFIDMPDLCFIDGDCWYFRCYEDDGFPLLQLSDEDCEFLITSTAEAPQQSTLVISPNPAEDKVNVALPGLPSNSSSLHLYHSSGQLLQTYSMEKGAKVQEVDLSQYPDGLYFIQWRQEEVVLSTSKVVKRR